MCTIDYKSASKKADEEIESHWTSALTLNRAKSPHKATLREEALTWLPESVTMRSEGGGCDHRRRKPSLLVQKWYFHDFLCARRTMSIEKHLVGIYANNSNLGFSVIDVFCRDSHCGCEYHHSHYVLWWYSGNRRSDVLTAAALFEQLWNRWKWKTTNWGNGIILYEIRIDSWTTKTEICDI